jgi:hypothetical protein
MIYNIDRSDKMENKTFHMIATKALHKLGDISREEGDLAIIYKEDENNYIGNWVTGFGFIDVKFPKDTTRDLTENEIEQYEKQFISAPWGTFPIKINKRIVK